MEQDTIAAIATAMGESGVGIVRVSGPLAPALAPALFPDLDSPWESHRLRLGRVCDPVDGRTLDHALGVLMSGPNTYTGEDVLEIHCHGSPLVLEEVLRTLLRAGCRGARPGEFTLRAFANGRLDLSQAEAVIDVVKARSNDGLGLAVRQLCGWLSEKIEPIRREVVGVAAHMEAMVDFVEEDVPAQLGGAQRRRLEESLTGVKALLAGTEQGIVLREGATLAIVGSPNVGKSSIMNGLLGMDRSIVTPIPGTTRDTVEETLQVRGVAFRTIDTAGITRTEDVVEQIGVARSKHAIDLADVVLLVFDRSRPLSAADEEVMSTVHVALSEEDGSAQHRRLVVAWNKADLPTMNQEQTSLNELKPGAIVESSTIALAGLDDLRLALEEAALGGIRREVVSGNVRHHDLLRRAGDALQVALAGLDAGTPLDLISFDVRAAAQALGEITGASVDDEVLDRIFRDFCIGK